MRALSLAIIISIIALAPGSAQAQLVLKISDPTSAINVTVRDNESGDTSGVTGVIRWVSADPATVQASITAQRDASVPRLNLAPPNLYMNVNYLATPLADLTVSLTDTGFSSSDTAGIATIIGGDLHSGGVVFNYYYDPNNQEFGQTNLITSYDTAGAFEFEEVIQGTVDLDPTASLTVTFTTKTPPVDPEALVSFQTSLEVEGDPDTPVTIGGQVTGLYGSGLVLQNNGTDDEAISGNGGFTFDTPLTPGSTYRVTVAQNPSNPDQSCFVDNDKGTVPTTPVTNVVVVCAPPNLPVAYVSPIPGCDGNQPCYASINNAMTASISASEIRIANTDFNEDVALNEDKSLVLSGGWDQDFRQKVARSKINSLTINNGSLLTLDLELDGD